jgi:HlyD family secretion protein
MSRGMFVLGCGAAALLGGLSAACREPSLQITYAQVTKGPVTREVLTSGTLEPAREVDAGVQVSGTVQSLHADFNSRVNAGQVIAQLDPAVYDTELAQARAQLIQAEAEAERKRVVAQDLGVKANRARELAAQDLITQAELDAAMLATKQAAADLDSARAAAASARALVKQAQVHRDRTIVRSPIDGVVVSRNVEVGQTLAVRLESPALFRIADLTRMRLLAEVSEAEVGGVSTGMEASFAIESLGGRQFRGRVSEVRLQPVAQQPSSVAATGRGGSAATNPAVPTSGTAQSTASAAPAQPAGSVVSYTAIIDVDNPDRLIAPGSTAIVTLPTAQRSDAIRIPNTTLSFSPAPAVLAAAGQADLHRPTPDRTPDPTKGRAGYVWKYQNGKFVPVEVRTGVSDEFWTEALSGSIQPGDKLVTSASLKN